MNDVALPLLELIPRNVPVNSEKHLFFCRCGKVADLGFLVSFAASHIKVLFIPIKDRRGSYNHSSVLFSNTYIPCNTIMQGTANGVRRSVKDLISQK